MLDTPSAWQHRQRSFSITGTYPK